MENEINKEDLQKILKLREFLIGKYLKCKDYKNNKNAIMREIDHAEVLNESIKQIDDFLKKYVQFS